VVFGTGQDLGLLWGGGYYITWIFKAKMGGTTFQNKKNFEPRQQQTVDWGLSWGLKCAWQKYNAIIHIIVNKALAALLNIVEASLTSLSSTRQAIGHPSKLPEVVTSPRTQCSLLCWLWIHGELPIGTKKVWFRKNFLPASFCWGLSALFKVKHITMSYQKVTAKNNWCG